MNPRVSVIVPAFNSEKVLPDALRSICRQTENDWEAIVVNDASTDRTAEAAAGFGDRVRLIDAPRNLGIAGARNLGIAHARGELLALLDADDWWLPDYLAEQVALYDSDCARGSNVGIVVCDALILGPDGFLPGTYGDRTPAPRRLTRAGLLKGNAIYASAIAPSAVVSEAGGFSSSCPGADDFDLWLRILDLGYEVARNPRPLAVYRLSPTSVSARSAYMARGTQMVFRRALERGHLGLSERYVARRELRFQRLVEDVAELTDAPAGGGTVMPALRLLPRAILVGIQRPRRVLLFARRIIRARRRGGGGPLLGRDGSLAASHETPRRRIGTYSVVQKLLGDRVDRETLLMSLRVRPTVRFAWRQLRRAAGVHEYALRDTSRKALVRHTSDDPNVLAECHGRQRGYDPPEALRASIDRWPPRTVLDLGANIGMFGLLALDRYPGCRVTGFEPDPANADVHERCIEANGLGDRWSLVRAFAAPSAGRVRFASRNSSSSHRADPGDPDAIEVEAVDVLEPMTRADLVKIDIEGAEWELLGDPRFRDLEAAAIVLEYHSAGCPQPDPLVAAAEALEHAGFRRRAVMERHVEGQGVIWAWRES